MQAPSRDARWCDKAPLSVLFFKSPVCLDQRLPSVILKSYKLYESAQNTTRATRAISRGRGTLLSFSSARFVHLREARARTPSLPLGLTGYSQPPSGRLVPPGLISHTPLAKSTNACGWAVPPSAFRSNPKPHFTRSPPCDPQMPSKLSEALALAAAEAHGKELLEDGVRPRRLGLVHPQHLRGVCDSGRDHQEKLSPYHSSSSNSSSSSSSSSSSTVLAAARPWSYRRYRANEQRPKILNCCRVQPPFPLKH